MQPHVSLVVVTRDRLQLVDAFLRSLGRQTWKNFSVVFAHDAACEAEAATLASKYGACFPLRRIALQPCGVSEARNRAMAHVDGDIIAFPDDDCEYLPDTLANVVETFARMPELGGILGVQITAQKATATYSQKYVGPYGAFGGSQTFLQFYTRACAEAVGGFDEKLGWGSGLPYGSGEDTDYVLRAIQLGYKVLRDPKVRVMHPWLDLDDPGLLFKTGRYAAGRMRLLSKHGFPFWYRLLTATAPLAMLPIDAARLGRKGAAWRWTMFCERMKGLRQD